MARELQHGNIAKGFSAFFVVPEADRQEFAAELGGVVVEDFEGRGYLIPADAMDALRLSDAEVQLVREAAGDPEVSAFEYPTPDRLNTFGLSFARWTDNAMTGKGNC